MSKATASYNLQPGTYDVFELASLYLRTAGFPDTALNRRILAAWFWSESQHSGKKGIVAYNNNPLNITTSSTNYHKFSGNSLHFANYATPQEGAVAWNNLLHANPGYRGIITALSIQDSAAFPSAVGKSPWGTNGKTITSSFWYMQHQSADVTGTLTDSFPKTTPSDFTINFGNATNPGTGIPETFSTTTVITADFVKNLGNDLYTKGAFGNDYVTANAAKMAFEKAMLPLIGQTWGAAIQGPLAQYIGAEATSQGANSNIIPDITGINAFFTGLSKSNVLHVAAIPAGAILLFFGMRLMLSQAGVGTDAGTGGGGRNTTLIQTRSYPVFMRR